MTPQDILTLTEHGVLAVVLWMLLQRVMARLDAVTDKLIEILQHQQVIVAQLDDQAYEKRKNSEV